MSMRIMARSFSSQSWLGRCAAISVFATLGACGETDYLPAMATGADAPAAVAKGRVDVEGGLIQIAAARDGVIADVMVEEGASIKAGQLLARQDATAPTMAWLEAKAAIGPVRERVRLLGTQLEAAMREEQRQAALARVGAETTRVSDEARDRVRQLRGELRVARAEVHFAEARARVQQMEVELREIRAPIDGIVVRRAARPGAGASTLNVTSLFTIAPKSPKIVRGELEESFINHVRTGQAVDIVPESSPERQTRGKVLRLGQVFGAKRGGGDDPNEKVDERVVEVIVTLDDQQLLIGQRVRINFLQGV
jgi:HlyD family secretion protein